MRLRDFISSPQAEKQAIAWLASVHGSSDRASLARDLREYYEIMSRVQDPGASGIDGFQDELEIAILSNKRKLYSSMINQDGRPHLWAILVCIDYITLSSRASRFRGVWLTSWYLVILYCCSDGGKQTVLCAEFILQTIGGDVAIEDVITYYNMPMMLLLSYAGVCGRDLISGCGVENLYPDAVGDLYDVALMQQVIPNVPSGWAWLVNLAQRSGPKSSGGD